MAGGAGVDWYAGWQNNAPTSDLSSEDLRVRANMWRLNKIALGFFNAYIPFQNMTAANDLIPGDNDYVFAQTNQTYLAYLCEGGSAEIDLTAARGTYDVHWFDLRNGGDLQTGSVTRIRGGQSASLGSAPSDPDQDWAVLLRRL